MLLITVRNSNRVDALCDQFRCLSSSNIGRRQDDNTSCSIPDFIVLGFRSSTKRQLGNIICNFHLSSTLMFSGNPNSPPAEKLEY